MTYWNRLKSEQKLINQFKKFEWRQNYYICFRLRTAETYKIQRAHKRERNANTIS